MKGVRVLSEREVRKQHAGVLFIAIFPFVGVLAAAALAWGRGLGWSDLAVFAIMYTIPILGITVGFHRMLTHASFDTKPWVRNTWAVFGSLAIEGDPITWVADHRRHHAHSDKEGDPHSPHLHHDDDDETLTGTLKGLYHAHFGWLFKKEASDVERWCPDLLKLPGLVAMSSKFYLFTIATFAIPALLGFVFTGGSWMGALTGFIWGGPVRVFFAHHVTFSTNSICHFFGKRPYDSGDHSTNNWMLSILSFGESWHNNHHAFPSSAVHGLEKHQIDISAMIIKGMAKVGLASNVRTPSARAMERKRIADVAAPASVDHA
ncbi:MAG: acyl-CoA desaturase [Thermoleophilia bacterium]|nr:acyl-CoA desaturase [Thermoleophilia bacterium]